MTALRRAPSPAALPPITRQARFGEHPCSQQQAGLLAVMRRLADRHGYQVACTATLDGPVDPSRLAAALDWACQRHTALLTSLRTTPAGPVQHVAAANLPHLDLADRTSVRSPGAVAAWQREHAQQPVAWDAAPLTQFHLLRGAEASDLLLVTHHWSSTCGPGACC